MDTLHLTAIFACLLVGSLARIVKPPIGNHLVERENEEKYQRNYDIKALLTRRGMFSCKELGDGCDGLPKCCGSTVCYWADGYSIRTDGRCVTCVSAGQMCQKDSQCCTGLVCQKTSTWNTDGRCGNQRPNGAACHDNDQCLSNNCNIDWVDNVRGEDRGRCE